MMMPKFKISLLIYKLENLMKESVIMNFYKIEKCGYYDSSYKNHYFGNISNILNQMHNWSIKKQKPLSSTCTFEINDDENESLRVFCFDMLKNKNDFLLTTWNETPSNQGRVPSVSGDQPVGSATVHLNTIEKGTIPGYATYFWFLTELNVLATLKFHNSLNGHKNLVRYISGFIESYSDHVVTSLDDDDNGEIEGYRNNKEDEAEQLSPLFRTKLLRKAGEISYIRENYLKVRKIIKKTTIDLAVEDENEESLLESMGRLIGIVPRFKNNNNINISYSLPFKPSKKDIDLIINKATEDGLSLRNDVGFQFIKSSKTIWLSNSIIRYDHQIYIKRNNAEIVNIKSLMVNLKEIRNEVVDMVHNLYD